MSHELPPLQSTDHLRILLDQFKFKTPISRIDVYHILQEINTRFYIPLDLYVIIIDHIVSYYNYSTKNDYIRSSSKRNNNYIVIRTNYDKKLKIRFKGYDVYMNLLEHLRNGLLSRKDIIDHIKIYNEITSLQDILIKRDNSIIILR